MFNPAQFMKIFPVLFLVVGIGLLSGAGYFAYQNYVILTTYSQTMGTVVRLSSGKTTRPVVEYRVSEGPVHIITGTVGSNPPAHKIGDKVSVIFPSDQPAQGQLNTFLELWFLSLLLGGMGAIFAGIGGGMSGYSWYRQKIVAKLKESGLQLETEFVSVDRNTSLEVQGTNPFQVVSQYEDKASNKIFVFKSDNLWFDPSKYLEKRTIPVVVNPENYGQYFVDLSFLPKLG